MSRNVQWPWRNKRQVEDVTETGMTHDQLILTADRELAEAKRRIERARARLAAADAKYKERMSTPPVAP